MTTTRHDIDDRTQDPLKTLLLFHRSIRAALQAFDDLVHAAEQGRVDEHKAGALHQFFVGPMRWHDVDEREFVLQPLARADESFAAGVNDAIAEHEHLEAIVERVLLHLASVAHRREWPNTAVLRAAALELRAAVEPHLEREERELFPAARKLLSAADLDRVEREIAERARLRDTELVPRER